MSYNGWKNRETWEVSLTINNNYGLYHMALEFMKTYKGNKPYRDFVEQNQLHQYLDGWIFVHPDLSISELNFMMRELKDEL